MIDAPDAGAAPAAAAAAPATAPNDAPSPSGALPEATSAPEGRLPASEGSAPSGGDPAVAAPTYEEIEALLDEKPHKVRADLKVPWKRGTETGYHTLKELQEGGMRLQDYHASKRELAQQRRDFEEQRIRTERRAQYLLDERKKFNEARRVGGDAWDRYQRHLDMLDADPDYAETIEKAALRMEDEAVHEHQGRVDHDDRVSDIVSDARNYITDSIQKLGARGAGLNPKRVEQAFMHAMQTGAPLRTSTVDAIINEELEYHASILKPLQDQLAGMDQRLKDLAAMKDVEQHNTRVDNARERAGAKAGQPVNGSPPGPSRPAPYNPETESVEQAKRRLGWIS